MPLITRRSMLLLSRNVVALAALCALTLALGAQTRPQTQPERGAGGGESAADQEKLAYVLMKTSKGDIVIELNREKAPISVANFLSYVDKKFYDGTIFHRVIPSFMIQGGGFDEQLNQKPTESPIKNEWTNGLKNKRGTIAMARLPGGVDSATCQFFINVVDNPGLDQPQRDGGGYAVFGQVIAGMNAVRAIEVAPTTTKKTAAQNDLPNTPVDTVKIETVRKITEDEAKKLAEAEKNKSRAG